LDARVNRTSVTTKVSRRDRRGARRTRNVDIVLSPRFTQKCRGLYSPLQIDALVTRLRRNPLGGERTGLGRLYRLAWTADASRRQARHVYYVYDRATQSLRILDLFALDTANVLTKLITAMADDFPDAT
jgi:hypothetical protein